VSFIVAKCINIVFINPYTAVNPFLKMVHSVLKNITLWLSCPK
jgi:hypothetical protein